MDIFMLKAYRYRLYPKGKQIEMLAWHFGHTRHVYNWALKLKIRYYRLYGKNISKRALQDRLVRRKRRMKYQWLNDVNSQSLLSALFHLDTAYNNFFSGRAKYPRFKTKKSNWHSFQCPQHVNIHQDEQRIDLPKIKGIKAVIHRPLEGVVKTCTIKKNPSGHYYISVLVDDHQPLPNKQPIKLDETLGVDVGLKDFIITSNGVKKANHGFLQRSLIKLNGVQKQLSRKQKKSNNKSKQRLIVARIHEKVVRQRNEYHHQIANGLLCDNQATTIAFEDLHIKGMIKNRKLSRHIADVAWSMF
jgi:putative transposase